jgi:hypothetical protein
MGRERAAAVSRQLVMSFVALMCAAILTMTAHVSGQLNQSGGAAGGGGGSNASVGTYPSTAPTNATLTGGQFKASPSTLTDGQMGAVMLDASGNVKVVAQGTTAISGNVGQSGTWTIQPGNTANTTPWFVKSIPLHNCTGNALVDVTQVDVATSAGSALASADTCVEYLYANNKTASAVTLTLQDKQGTAVVYSTSFSVPANSDIFRYFNGHKFTGGVQAIAGTSSAINAVLKGIQ